MRVTEETALIKESQAILVFMKRLANPKLTDEEACNEVGITLDHYHYWIQRDPDAMEAIRQYIVESQRSMMFEIEMAWPVIVHELVVDATDGSTKTKDRISATKLLNSMKEDLERTHHAQPGVEDEAHTFLKQGPKLKQIPSRMASVEVSPTDSGGVRLDISRYSDVIESRLIEPEEAKDTPPQSTP